MTRATRPLTSWSDASATAMTYAPRALSSRKLPIMRSRVSSGGTSAHTGVPGSISPDLVAAVQQEYRKLGRLVLEREFGDYLTLLR